MDFPESRIQALEASVSTMRNLADTLEYSVKILKKIFTKTPLRSSERNADTGVLGSEARNQTPNLGAEVNRGCNCTLGEAPYGDIDFPRLTCSDVKSLYANLHIKKFLSNIESFNPDPTVRTKVALQNIDKSMAIHIRAMIPRSGNQWQSFRIVIYELYGKKITLEEALTEISHLKPPVHEGEEEYLEEFLEKYECLSQMVKELPSIQLAFKIKVFEVLPDELQSYFKLLLVSGNVTIQDFINLVQEKLKVYHAGKGKGTGRQ